MNKLPAETLIEIFKFLHFQQKLECMLVCRAWAQILRVYLLDTIELSVTTTFTSFNRCLHSLKKIAKSGTQPGLTKCTINQRLKSNVLINLIGKHMIQLEHLDVLMFMDKKHFHKLTSSQALYSLVSLSLHCLPRDFELARLKKFTKLKELTLDFSNVSNFFEKYHTIAFDDIVDELPKNIDTLCLKYIIITLE